MCCDRSHLRAIQYAGEDSSPEFSVIFEDDVAVHTTLFCKGVEELMENWKTIANNRTIISLGWVPCSNYDSYVPAKSLYTMKCSTNHKIICDRYIVGLQAYMMHKDNAKFIASSLLKETYNEYHAVCDTHASVKESFYAFDVFLPKYIASKFMFPPLVIEQNIPSTLGHKNELDYWPQFFKGYETLQDDYWNNVKLQCIVIYLNEGRRAIIEAQFKELGLPFPVHYLKASTPETLKQYLASTSFKDNKNLRASCGHSHLRALEYAGLYTSPKFSLIMEDDVSLHKQSFIPAVCELIQNWSSLNMKCVSLGWVPISKFDNYIGNNSVYAFDSSPSHRIMDDRDVVGLQAYMITKQVGKSTSALFLKETYNEFVRCASIEVGVPESPFLAIDTFLPRFLKSNYVFPPLAIEQPVRSSLCHINEQMYWSNFFEGYEHLIKEYWSIRLQCIVIWLTEERRALIEQQFKELQVPFPVHYMKASTPQTIPAYLSEKHTPTQQKLSCCGHSHFRALQYAGLDTSPEFTIVCEDDVSLHKTLFIPAVKELLENWKAVVGNSSPQSMVSLGWVPCYNFDSYVGKSVYKFNVSPKHDIKNDRWTVGTQSYIVHKESAKITAKKFLTETYAEYLKLANEVEKLFDVSYPIDHLLQRYLTVRYVFPPLAVDQQMESTINPGIDPGFYNIFFKNYEHLRNDYWKGASPL
jgi:GR25 family glycosyltransferase involved in LPS biosynthesis